MFLWESIAFGPIRSRRLGNSLGINILPVDKKICSFNCIYCECGWTLDKNTNTENFFPAEMILEAAEKKLEECRRKEILIDSITFAGNGEPTLHPDFDRIIDGLIVLRNRYYPESKITCLSNSTMLYKPGVRDALRKIENPILKLDAGSEHLFRLINKPMLPVTLHEIVSWLKEFGGNLVIQTLLFRGNLDGEFFDNSTGVELDLLLDHIRIIRPRNVMLYSLDRETPARSLIKLPAEDLEKVAVRISEMGIEVHIY